MFPALAEALQAVGPGKVTLYYDVVLGLSVAARARWEEFMTTTAGYQYQPGAQGARG